MTADEKSASGKGGEKRSPGREAGKPDWSNGLRQLYDSVLDEELPDTFKDLLSKLDDKD
ncbi:MAG: NepR family anti-sigma factor [Erythrobacter sp.]